MDPIFQGIFVVTFGIAVLALVIWRGFSEQKRYKDQAKQVKEEEKKFIRNLYLLDDTEDPREHLRKYGDLSESERLKELIKMNKRLDKLNRLVK